MFRKGGSAGEGITSGLLLDKVCKNLGTCTTKRFI